MDSSLVNTAGAGGYITQLNPNDVLFGRGSGPNDHEGNIRFRDLVGERKTEYMATNHRQTKAKIAREIVGSVIEKNGRFLKKVEAAEAKELGILKGIEAWIPVDEETIMEKAKQALRQQRDKSKSGGGSPVPPARKPLARSPVVSNDSYANATVQYETEAASAVNLRQAALMHNAHGAYLHPNPYEPIPIGSHAVLGRDNPPNMDWRQFTQAAIMAQTQGHRQPPLNPQLETIPQPAVSNAHVFARAMSRDGIRRESIQVSDLMDSFNNMQTKEFDNHHESHDTLGSSNNHESIDTIGTIEPLPIGLGPSSMNFSSGNFSGVMKALLNDSSRPCDTTAMLKGITEDLNFDPTHYSAGTPKSSFSRGGRRETNRQSISIEDKDFFKKGKGMGAVGSSDFSNMSMSFSQVWSSKGPANLGNLTEADESEERVSKRLADDQQHAEVMDDDPDNMSGLGKSSMSILNVAMGDSNCESIMTANDSIFSDIGD